MTWFQGFLAGTFANMLVWGAILCLFPAVKRYRLWRRAYNAAQRIVVGWKFTPSQHDSWAAAIADQFVRRIDIVGYAEAVKELDHWDKLADETREFLHSAEPASKRAKYPGNVVELRRK